MKRLLLPVLALALLLGSCGRSTDNTGNMIEIDSTLTEAEISEGILTPEVMWKLGRAGSSVISPDGKTVVYTVTNYSIKENKGVTRIFFTELETSTTVKLTDGTYNDSDPSWNHDGSTMYFLSDRSGSAQVWKMDIITKQLIERKKYPTPVQVTDIPDGVDGYKKAPAGQGLLYVKRVKVDPKRSSDKYADLDKSNAMIYDSLMARHWDRWEDGSYLHIFVTEEDRDVITEGKDLMPGEPWDAPMAPYFDMSEISWDSSGKKVAYTCKKIGGVRAALSTDSDIFIHNVETGMICNITEGMPGYDRYPRFSPDGRHIVWRSMDRGGNEADKERLMVMDTESKVKRDLTEGFDYSATNVEWFDNNHVFFISGINGTERLCWVDVQTEKPVVQQSIYGSYDVTNFSTRNGQMVAEIVSLSMPVEIYRVEPYDGQISQFTTINSHILDHIKMGSVSKRMIKTTDGKQMLTWVVVPPDFDPEKKYPVLLYCQGGPQSTVSQFWSYRWNLQLMAAQGYVVVAPNRRGTPSFGSEWLDQISGDYSGQNIRDYLSAIDDVSSESWADNTRMGCVGASYGGYSAFFLMGNHQKRFKAFIAHCGMFNLESMYGATEELWFPNNDLGGPYWSESPVAKRSYANSPHKFVKNWDTPILIMTGANDFRIPYTESLQAFTAAQLMGLPSRLVFFENEAHQVFKPQNSLTWNREFFDWLDTYVKNPKKK